MASQKKTQEGARRRLKRELQSRESRRERSAPISASFVRLDLPREIDYITELAQAEDSRIVTVGNLVLFSTRTRDAWLLDREDDFALCLCRDGERQPLRTIDNDDTIAIEWPARFAIEGTTFIVQERSGKAVIMQGYPTAEISAACQGRSAEQ